MMREFTIEIKVKAPSSGCAYDWAIRSAMGEANYCEVEEITVFNEDGRDVTEDEEVYLGFNNDYFASLEEADVIEVNFEDVFEEGIDFENQAEVFRYMENPHLF